jgi:hypothetical protein
LPPPPEKGDKLVSSENDAAKEFSKRLNWFGRLGFAPQDQNFVGFYLDTGLVYEGLNPIA